MLGHLIMALQVGQRGSQPPKDLAMGDTLPMYRVSDVWLKRTLAFRHAARARAVLCVPLHREIRTPCTT